MYCRRHFRIHDSCATRSGLESAIHHLQWSVKCERRPWPTIDSFVSFCTIYAYACLVIMISHINNPSPSADAYLVREQSCQISSWSDLKWWRTLDEKKRDNKHKNKQRRDVIQKTKVIGFHNRSGIAIGVLHIMHYKVWLIYLLTTFCHIAVDAVIGDAGVYRANVILTQ